jgi:hypothetical protein
LKNGTPLELHCKLPRIECGAGVLDVFPYTSSLLKFLRALHLTIPYRVRDKLLKSLQNSNRKNLKEEGL